MLGFLLPLVSSLFGFGGFAKGVSPVWLTFIYSGVLIVGKGV